MTKQSLLLCSILWGYLLPLGHVQAAELHRGFNPLGKTDVMINGQRGNNESKLHWDGLAFAISRSKSSTMCSSANQQFNLKTIDGYTGYEFAPGFLFVLYSGSLTGQRDFVPEGRVTYSYIFSATGELSPTLNTGGAWCADPRETKGLGYTKLPITLLFSQGYTTGSVLSGIYISESTPLGSTAVLENLYINRGAPKTTPDSGPNITGTGDTYRVVGQLECSISAPPVIDFHKVNLSGNEVDGTLLTNETGKITVNCTGDPDAELNATVTVNGTKARYTDTLKMTMTNSTAMAPAEIRGFIGPDITQMGVCEGSANYPGMIQFTDSNQHINAGILKPGSNTIPYNFSLCSTGKYTLGEATATATLNISWD